MQREFRAINNKLAHGCQESGHVRRVSLGKIPVHFGECQLTFPQLYSDAGVQCIHQYSPEPIPLSSCAYKGGQADALGLCIQCILNF